MVGAPKDHLRESYPARRIEWLGIRDDGAEVSPSIAAPLVPAGEASGIGVPGHAIRRIADHGIDRAKDRQNVAAIAEIERHGIGKMLDAAGHSTPPARRMTGTSRPSIER